MPAEQVERDVYGELLNAMNAPGPIGYTAFRLKAIRSPMRSMRVRMLVIDEVPPMLTGTTGSSGSSTMSFGSGKRTEGATDLCRNGPARQALLTDPQLAERFETFHLMRWLNDKHLALRAQERSSP